MVYFIILFEFFFDETRVSHLGVLGLTEVLFDSQGVRHVSNLKQNKETPRHFFRVAKQRGTGSLGSAATVAADPEDRNENKESKIKDKMIEGRQHAESKHPKSTFELYRVMK